LIADQDRADDDNGVARQPVALFRPGRRRGCDGVFRVDQVGTTNGDAPANSDRQRFAARRAVNLE
jgi:hypothetical protein